MIALLLVAIPHFWTQRFHGIPKFQDGQTTHMFLHQRWVAVPPSKLGEILYYYSPVWVGSRSYFSWIISANNCRMARVCRRPPSLKKAAQLPSICEARLLKESGLGQPGIVWKCSTRLVVSTEVSCT